MMCLASSISFGQNIEIIDNIEPISTNILYSINDDILFIAGIDINGSCICKTEDGGITWNRLYVDESISNIKFKNIYVGYYITGTSIYKTEDGGNIWYKLYKFDDISTNEYIKSFNVFDNGIAVITDLVFINQ